VTFKKRQPQVKILCIGKKQGKSFPIPSGQRHRVRARATPCTHMRELLDDLHCGRRVDTSIGVSSKQAAARLTQWVLGTDGVAEHGSVKQDHADSLL